MANPCNAKYWEFYEEVAAMKVGDMLRWDFADERIAHSVRCSMKLVRPLVFHDHHLWTHYHKGQLWVVRYQ